MKAFKLVVTGVGHVGSYVLADAMKAGLFAEIAVIDVLENVARGEALDQWQATGVGTLGGTRVHAGSPADYADADVVVVAAGPSILPDPDDPTGEPDRTLLTTVNAAVVRQVMGEIAANTSDAVVIFITNPLDTIVYIAENEFGYPAGRVFGTGTMLDSARLRQFVAAACGVSPTAVSGYMMGEHGHTAFPVLSRLTVAGLAWDELPAVFGDGVRLDPEHVRRQVVKAAFDVLNGKGWTNAGVAQAAVQLARAVLLDEQGIYPVSSTLRGEYGHDGDVALSLPTLIGRRGIERRIPVALDAWERDHLADSISYIQQAMAEAGTPRSGSLVAPRAGAS